MRRLPGGPRRAAVPLLAAALLLVGGSCGGDGEDETQPVPEGTTFSLGAFDDLPLPPRSDQIGPPAEVQDAVTATYTTEGATAPEILDFYVEELAGAWERVDGPREIGDGVWRGDWIRDGRRLEVVVAPAPEADQAAEKVDESELQFSLILNEDAEDNPADPYFDDTAGDDGVDEDVRVPDTTSP